MTHLPQGCAPTARQATREDTERRGEPRSAGPRVRGLSARIRGSHDVRVVDLSASGALTEGSRPLRPGSRVEVHLAIESRRFVLPARVARCLVAAIDADRGITYQAALSFESRFDWACEGDTLLVSGMHGVCSS
jgi:hypothetical protein